MVSKGSLALAAALLAAATASAQTPPAAPVAYRIEAAEARQGVASDGIHVYAIDNNTIAKYRIADGTKLAEWHGEPDLFPHINSCTVAGRDLVCAASNHPGVPQLSAIEFFDVETLEHTRSVSLGMGPGSLTVIDRHDGHWWAVFANYDGNGGDPARNHRYTLLARLDEDFRIARGWAFPDEVLACFAPKSASGASWGADGRLYASGHDRPEIYVLELPEAGSVLRHAGTVPVGSRGQAIDFDPADPGLLWSIDRKTRTILGSRLGSVRQQPPVAGTMQQCNSAQPG